MPQTDGTMIVRVTLSSGHALTVIVPDYSELRSRVLRMGSYPQQLRQREWYDALEAADRRLVAFDVGDVVALEEVTLETT